MPAKTAQVDWNLNIQNVIHNVAGNTVCGAFHYLLDSLHDFLDGKVFKN